MWRPLAVLCRLRPAKARSFAEAVGGVQYFSLDGSPNKLRHALAAIRDKRPQQVMLETCAERQVLNSRLTQEEASPETGEQGRVLSHGDAIAFIHGGLRGSDARALTVVAEEVGSQVYTVDRSYRETQNRVARRLFLHPQELLAFSRYAASALSVGSEDPSRIAEECPAAVSQILGSEREQHMASEITKRVVDGATVFVICTESRLAALKELVAKGAAHADMADVAASRIWPFLLILVYAILPSYGTMFVFWRAARGIANAISARLRVELPAGDAEQPPPKEKVERPST